jgi:hypothetical protein
VRDATGERESGPVAPERFAVLQALLAHLLAACGEERRAVISARELAADVGIPREALEESARRRGSRRSRLARSGSRSSSSAR